MYSAVYMLTRVALLSTAEWHYRIALKSDIGFNERKAYSRLAFKQVTFGSRYDAILDLPFSLDQNSAF